MNITREKPCQRRHHRVRTPLEIKINGHVYHAVDWSLGGFRIAGWNANDFGIGSEIECYFKLPFQGFDIAFEVTARIVRIDGEAVQMAAQFDGLSDRQTELMSHFIEDLVRGAMSSVEDTILRIDSPVTPVSTAPDPSPAGQVPVKRWPTKLIVMSSLYVTAGFVLSFYIFFIVYSNFFSLEVDSGVVAAPIERIISTTDGQIVRVNATLDRLVPRGENLITLENASIEEQIALAKISVERSQSLLEAKRSEHSIEEANFGSYQNMAANKLKEAEVRHTVLTKQFNSADEKLVRYRDFYQRQLISRKAFDEAVNEHLRLSSELELAAMALKARRDAIQSLKEGHYVAGEMSGQSDEIKVEIGHLKQEVTLATLALVALYERRDRLNIKAPSQGRIVELVKSSGSSTKRGETIAFFERDEQRVIEVYLTQDEVISIKLSQPARVYFPALDVAVDSKVVAIDRTEGSFNEKESRYSWGASDDRTAKVTLSLVGLSALDIRARFTPGLPAMVVFPNLSTGTFGDLLRSFKSQITPHHIPAIEKEMTPTVEPHREPYGLSI